MQTIWKYKVVITGSPQEIDMPQGARVLCVQVQDDAPHIWVEVDPQRMEIERRSFYVTGTGLPLPLNTLSYIGTFQLFNGEFVGHLYELIKATPI